MTFGAADEQLHKIQAELRGGQRVVEVSESQSREKKSERAILKTRILAMKCAKWLQTRYIHYQANRPFVALARFARLSLKMRTISLRSAQHERGHCAGDDL